MADQERADAYNAALRRAMKAWADADLKMAADVRAAIVKYRDAAVATLANDGTEWDARQRRQTVARLNDALAVMDRDMGAAFNDAMDAAVKATIMGVDDPLTAFGVNVAQYRPVLPVEQIALIKSVAPSMITDVTTEVHQKVQGELLRFSLGGGGSRQQVIERIGNLTGPIGTGELKEGQIIPRAEVRARGILRNEMNRVSNITSTARIDDLAKRDTGFGKKWIHYYSPEPRAAHEALHGKVIFPAKGEKFNVNGTLADGPHDPVLPASESINCRCKVVAHYDPAQSEAMGDSVVAAAPSGSGAPAATPAGAPKPAKTAIDKAKPAAKAKPKPKPKPEPAAAADAGPVTVVPAGPASGSKIPKPAKVNTAASAKAKPAAAFSPRQFEDAEAAIDYHSQQAATQMARFSDDQIEGWTEYQRGSFWCNSPLRNDIPLSPDGRGWLKSMRKTMTFSRTPEDVVAYRGLNSPWPGFTDADPRDLVGTIVRDKGFMSTSISGEGADAFTRHARITIKVPKGSKGLYLDINSGYRWQAELVLNENTGLRIMSAKRVNGVLEVMAEVVQ